MTGQSTCTAPQTAQNDSLHTTVSSANSKNASAALVSMESPPLVDPTVLRRPKLTPNLREIVRSFGHATPDMFHGPMGDIPKSPELSNVYTPLHGNTPALRDFYPTALDTTLSPDETDLEPDRAAEMQALFAVCVSTEDAHDALTRDGAISLLSSPDVRHGSVDATNTMSPGSGDTTVLPSRSSASLSESLSPELGPRGAEKDIQNESSTTRTAGQRATGRSSGKDEKGGSGNNKRRERGRRRGVLSTGTSHAVAAGVPAAAPIRAGPVPAVGAVPSVIPYPLPVGIPNPVFPVVPGMLDSMRFGGRPMAWIPGAHGPSLVPVDMLGHMAHFAKVQPAQQQQQQQQSLESGASDGASGLRKRRRRQPHEDSICTGEQARRNRALALVRLRQKKSIRSYEKTVRYACRKKIAMVRPRVNGRFATKEEVEECRRSGRFLT